MTLRVAVQMDPIDQINIAGDSSFALMLAAQARGYAVFEYHVESLTLDEDDRLFAHAHPVTVQRVAGDHFTRGEQVRLDLGKDIDVVLMRQDPPFHMGYITATHMLERIAGETLVVNDPANVRNSPEKVMVLNYRRFMPPTLVTRSVDEVRRFMAKHGAIVVKPIHGNGGKAIFRIGENGENLTALFEVFNQTWPEPHMVQPFLPEVAKGDKRIVLIDGVVARGENETLDPVGGHIPGAINRFFRDNLDANGCFKQAACLQEEFGKLIKGGDAHAVVHQCGSGVTACHNLLAMEVAGLSGAKLYAGSWSEWCSDPARPIATGP